MTEELDEYKLFSEKINEKISATMLGLDMNVENYSLKDMWDVLCSDEAVIRGFPFDGKARQAVSGMIVNDADEITIAFNERMSQNRINFTISHELTHYLYHIDKHNRYFYDTKDTLAMNDPRSLVEFQANIGAAAILLPDPVFIHELKNGTMPAEISKRYGISESALVIRMVKAMESEFGASYNGAYKVAMKILNRYGHSGQASMKELGRNLEKKIIYTNPFYEGLIV